jgi:hypothetical protein
MSLKNSTALLHALKNESMSNELLLIKKGNKMANYAIIRHEKRYGPDMVNGIWAENIRSILGNNVDKSRSHLNITVTPLEFDNYDDFVNTRKQQIRITNKQRHPLEKKARMPRVKKDKKTANPKFPALMQEFVFTHSHGALPENESIRYCELAYKFISEWFGECNILLAVIHLDEETPHVHIWTDYYNKFENRFIQSILQDDGKTDIRAIRDAWQKKIEEEGFELIKQDGRVVGDKHDGSKADKNKGDLKKQINELTATVNSLEESKLVLENDNAVLRKEIKLKDIRIEKYMTENTKLTDTVEHLTRILPPWHKYLKQVYNLDISKEMPPIEELNPKIASTLESHSHNTMDSNAPTIPSLL